MAERLKETVRYADLTDYDYPRCSHNGFYSDCANDFVRKNRLSGSKEQMVTDMLFSGHLHYLKMTGEPEACELWERTLRDFENCNTHICLPDDPEQWITDEERDFYIESGDVNKVMPRIKQAIKEIPPRMTLSVKHRSMEIIQFWEWWEGKVMIVTAHRRGQLQTQGGEQINMERIKKDQQYRNRFRDDQIDLLAGTCWAGASHGIELDPDPKQESDHFMAGFRLLSGRGNDKDYEDSVNRAGMIAFTYLLFMSRPAEDVHVSRDPNWTPKKLHKKQIRRGVVEQKEPQKIRLYVPKRRVITDPDAVLTESSTGSKQQEHERQGHWRTYRDGRRIWIETYTAGDNRLGTKLRPKVIEIVPRRKDYSHKQAPK